MTNEIDTKPDKLIWRIDLPAELKVTSETVGRWIREGMIPKPDVNISRRTKAWKISTLRAASINID